MTVSRTVVIIGCSRGIGLGILEYFAGSESCKHLVGVARKSKDIDALRTQFAGNPKVHILQADVTDGESIERMAGEVSALGLVPDLLVYNSGILTEPRPFDRIQVDDLRESMEVNVIGAMRAMQAFLPLMRNIEGAVMVNVSSGWGLWGSKGQSTYCASKHALEGLMKCVAEDVKEDSVSVVTVRPGVVYTDMLVTAMGSKELAETNGVAVEKFASHFCNKILTLTKAESGTHIDCGYKGL